MSRSAIIRAIWYNAVARGDINRIVIGHHTNIQDNAVLHLADEFALRDRELGDGRSLGHCPCLHGGRRNAHRMAR